MDDLLEKLRRAEIESVREWFRPGTRVLEIGGGSGWQASLIASWGCEVVSIDVADRPAPPVQYFPVQTYDGEHIPFPDDSFDLVVSSNVLEHVRALVPLLAETRRVLRPGGQAVHILPSSSRRRRRRARGAASERGCGRFCSPSRTGSTPTRWRSFTTSAGGGGCGCSGKTTSPSRAWSGTTSSTRGTDCGPTWGWRGGARCRAFSARPATSSSCAPPGSKLT